MAACVKHAARAMVKAGVKGGSIVCKGSLLATAGMDHFIDYVMSKHAVIGLVWSASKGLGEHGIRVNCVSLGTVATPIACKELIFSDVEECEKYFETNSRLKGCGVLKARDVANTILYMASQGSQFVAVQKIVVGAGTVRV